MSDIERLCQIAAEATPGKWCADALGSEGYLVREAEGKPRPGSRILKRIRVARCGLEDWDTDKANAQYIATFDPPTVLSLLNRLKTAEAMVADYENRITWDTTCGNCANLLDKSYADYVRADKAEAMVARVEALVDECASSSCIHLNGLWGRLRAALTDPSGEGK